MRVLLVIPVNLSTPMKCFGKRGLMFVLVVFRAYRRFPAENNVIL